jgi:hypothetical protein
MNGTPILPDGYQAKSVQTVKMPNIFPADPTISEVELLNATLSGQIQKKSPQDTMESIVEKLESAEGPLVFERPLASFGSRAISGSVSNEDICQEILTRFKVNVAPHQVFVRHGHSFNSNVHFKAVGDYSVIIYLTREQKTMSVELDVVVKATS